MKTQSELHWAQKIVIEAQAVLDLADMKRVSHPGPESRARYEQAVERLQIAEMNLTAAELNHAYNWRDGDEG